MSQCIRCNHIHSPVDGVCITNLKSEGRDCDCDSQSYVPKEHKPGEFIPEQYHFEVLNRMRDYEQRVRYTILSIDGARDLDTEDFKWLCWHYWISFREGDVLTPEIKFKIKKFAQSDTIRRTRQAVCHEELEQLRNFQKALEAIKPFSDEYWRLTEEIKKFWTGSKLIPRNWEYLRAKGIKESTIFEWSIEELNTIC